MKEYTKEFHKILIRTRHLEVTKEKIARYINGLRSRVQEEIEIVRVVTMEDAYQITLNIEERLNKMF